MNKSQPFTEAHYRSLLQKAVRRGNTQLVFTTSALLESLSARRENWLRTRAAIITFEECWPLGRELVFNRKLHSKVAALIKVTQSAKTRDATGLGYLAFALVEGDRSVLTGSADDRHLKIVANAVQRPDDFWQWIDRQNKTPEQASLVAKAIQYRQAGSPMDKAVIQAAAYLAVTGEIPSIRPSDAADQVFPYWVVFDKHTPEGQRALRDVARDLHIPLPQLEWTHFYFEGALTNCALASKWWDGLCRWHFNKIGLALEEAYLLWEPAKPQVMEALAGESRTLHNELYKWKLANRERIDSLKKQVKLFVENFDGIPRDQMGLF
ncbi:MAG: hypothetical protein JSW39_23195 [Desulfobacterales bacterium]|nr:MAG: hypothetical protein JSW39_23195 [Desulfobacterales bacterium]